MADLDRPYVFRYVEDSADTVSQLLGKPAPVRPVVTVRLSNPPEATYRVVALVDSGSERTFAAPGLARALRLDLSSVPEVVIGLGGARVLFPEYRLAPEHPFPAAVDDVLAAWRWLRTDQDLKATSIAVAGDSAGGGLAVTLLVVTRDAGEPLPAAAVLMSPTVDLTGSGASMTERAGDDPISTPAMLGRFASDYLAGADPKMPLASPLFASLCGLPPLLIQVGTADLLLSDSERLATAAAEAGVDVTLEIGEGLPHVYQLMLGAPEAAEATEQSGKFLMNEPLSIVVDEIFDQAATDPVSSSVSVVSVAV